MIFLKQDEKNGVKLLKIIIQKYQIPRKELGKTQIKIMKIKRLESKIAIFLSKEHVEAAVFPSPRQIP